MLLAGSDIGVYSLAAGRPNPRTRGSQGGIRLIFFSRSFLRSAKILLQNCAILRNALRKRNYELPSVSNAVQSSETLRNSLGVN